MENEEMTEKIRFNEEGQIVVNQDCYELVENYRDAFDLEQFQNRYSDILQRYDFIVGDMGYGQLRLRGFFYDDNKNAPYEWKIGTLDDYLYEYCNFGCAYFVLERVTGSVGVYHRPRKNNNNKKKKSQHYMSEKKGKTNKKMTLKKNKKTKERP